MYLHAQTKLLAMNYHHAETFHTFKMNKNKQNSIPYQISGLPYLTIFFILTYYVQCTAVTVQFIFTRFKKKLQMLFYRFYKV